ncbi:hypothetical protein EH223_01845 [candidate division KSB1 bacterium]|nr:hypothetical protein [candidate division KSB1 bacterium]RQW06728.1 MAG: hypothetical protein EH223_01845 [candidate division KSB1 bacterium]
MNRRTFLSTSASVACAALIPFACQRRKPEINIVTRLVQQNDKNIPRLLTNQEANTEHTWFGGVVDAYGIHSAGHTAAFIRDLTCALLSPQSAFFQSEHILECLIYAMQFMLKQQHADGTIDLHTTNFFSTPDTAFVMEWLGGVYGLLKQSHSDRYAGLSAMLEEFILKAAEALTVGGIHTPNHRWVVCMALARAYSLFPDPRFIERIDTWLREHIDIDPDGQFTEKSASIYSPLTDRCLITMARLLNRPELYEPVRANLTMTLYYIHPNGKVVTEASKRQDQYQFGDMAPYYYPYRFLALLDNNGQFAGMANWIEATPKKITSCLMYFLEDEQLQQELPVVSPLPTHYEKFFSYSNLARFRRGDVSATVLADNYTLFSFRTGGAILQAVRLAAAFFGKGQFKGEKLDVQDGIYVMSQKLDGPYYQPFPEEEIPEDGDWEKMDKEKRPKSEIQELETTISIREHNAVFTIDIHIKGTDRVPIALELAFQHGGKFKGVEKIKDVKDAYFLKKGFGQYILNGQTIEFGPGQHQHRWTHLRGAEEKLDAMSVYLTGFTPLLWTMTING